MLRICTYNVRNLILSGAEPKSDKEIKALVVTLKAISADLVALQEVESVAALQLVNERLDTPYPHLYVQPGNSRRGIHLGFLSRVPLSLRSHREVALLGSDGRPFADFVDFEAAQQNHLQSVRLERDLLLAEFEPRAGVKLALFNVHLKSKVEHPWRRCNAEQHRQAESRLVADTVAAYAAMHPHTSILLVGDFNDTRHSDALAPIFRLPLQDPLGEKLKRTGANPSTFWSRRRLRIDFILAWATNPLRWIDDGVRIHTSTSAQRASDHYPVSVDFPLR